MLAILGNPDNWYQEGKLLWPMHWIEPIAPSRADKRSSDHAENRPCYKKVRAEMYLKSQVIYHQRHIIRSINISGLWSN